MNKKSWIGALLLVGVWLVLSTGGVSTSLYFPDFFRIFNSFIALIVSLELYKDIFYTLSRMYVAFIIAGILGTWLGLWFGLKEAWFEALEWIIEFLRAIPSPVLFPLALLLLATDELAKIIVAIYTCFFINLLYAYYGAQNVDRAKLDLFQSLKAKKSDVVNRLIVWAALPSVVGGLRITLTIALILIVITEMLGGSPHGLGVKIYNASAPHKVAERYALILILGLVGFILNKFFVRIEKGFLHWRGA